MANGVTGQIARVTALADCIRLITRSCDEYWETIHPEMVDDIEYRTNVFDWIRRVLGAHQKIPLTENTGVGQLDGSTLIRPGRRIDDSRPTSPKLKQK